MRINIEIHDQLMRQAMRCSGSATKKAVVEERLRLLVQTFGQTSIRRLRGKVRWEGDLAESRPGAESQVGCGRCQITYSQRPCRGLLPTSVDSETLTFSRFPSSMKLWHMTGMLLARSYRISIWGITRFVQTAA